MLPPGARAADEAGGKDGRRLAELARRHRRDRHRLRAARGTQLRQLLPGVPLAQVRALVAPRQGPGDSAEALLQTDLLPPGDKLTDYILTAMPAPDAAELVRQDSARPVADGARARSRLPLPVPEDLLRRSARARRARTTCACRRRAMPDVLSDLEGLKSAVFRDAPSAGAAAGTRAGARPFRADRPGSMSAGGVRQLRARHGQLPRLRQRARPRLRAARSACGWCCSCWYSRGSPGW